MTTSTNTCRTDFERGAAAGAAIAQSGADLPPLTGGAFAVGVLFGYRSAAGRPTPAAARPLETSGGPR